MVEDFGRDLKPFASSVGTVLASLFESQVDDQSQ